MWVLKNLEKKEGTDVPVVVLVKIATGQFEV